jgi:dihydrofolate reductase
MIEKTVSMIVAASENGVIGKDGDMPWRLSADLKNFKAITLGHTIIMGRKTWDSIQRLLPGRQTVIVTRQKDFKVDGAIVVGNLEEALAATEDESPFVVGGAEIYRLALPHVTKIYLTRVHAEIDGDTWMPEVDFSKWNKLESVSHSSDEKNSHDYSFEIYKKT